MINNLLRMIINVWIVKIKELKYIVLIRHFIYVKNVRKNIIIEGWWMDIRFRNWIRLIVYLCVRNISRNWSFIVVGVGSIFVMCVYRKGILMGILIILLGALISCIRRRGRRLRLFLLGRKKSWLICWGIWKLRKKKFKRIIRKLRRLLRIFSRGLLILLIRCIRRRVFFLNLIKLSLGWWVRS